MNFLLSLWYRFFGEPAVAKAVKHLNRSIDKLQRAVDYQSQKASALRAAAERAANQGLIAEQEAFRSSKVRAKLADLLEVE